MCNCGGGSKPPQTWQVVDKEGKVVQTGMTSVQARVYASRTPGAKAQPKAA